MKGGNGEASYRGPYDDDEERLGRHGGGHHRRVPSIHTWGLFQAGRTDTAGHFHDRLHKYIVHKQRGGAIVLCTCCVPRVCLSPPEETRGGGGRKGATCLSDDCCLFYFIRTLSLLSRARVTADHQALSSLSKSCFWVFKQPLIILYDKG